MDSPSPIEVRPVEASDKDWIRSVLREHWGSEIFVTRGHIHRPAQLPGFIAVVEGHRFGLATYTTVLDNCELVTLNSLRPGAGIGDALLNSVRDAARAEGCRRLWLITTNDNLSALRFYQKRGFVLAALHRNAITSARRIKPQIPLIGDDGIPLRDEFELECML